ncbi:MAG TPA: hypothetical protein VJ597_01785 [Sphingomicrobium sp.]|nr:hypothetical protein [Sphingomicrobium sp.]
MRKSLVVLAIFSTMSVPALAQPGNTTSGNAVATAPAKPQMVKKRVCFQDDEDSYSRLGGRKICKTVEVPAEKTAGGSQGNDAPASSQPHQGH